MISINMCACRFFFFCIVMLPLKIIVIIIVNLLLLLHKDGFSLHVGHLSSVFVGNAPFLKEKKQSACTSRSSSMSSSSGHTNNPVDGCMVGNLQQKQLIWMRTWPHAAAGFGWIKSVFVCVRALRCVSSAIMVRGLARRPLVQTLGHRGGPHRVAIVLHQCGRSRLWL